MRHIDLATEIKLPQEVILDQRTPGLIFGVRRHYIDTPYMEGRAMTPEVE
jgi:hypothetical protein